jgi:hypothetical protein
MIVLLFLLMWPRVLFFVAWGALVSLYLWIGYRSRAE